MDVDDERVFGTTQMTDHYAHSNISLQVPPDTMMESTQFPPASSRSASAGAGRSASIAVYSSSTSAGASLSPAPQQAKDPRKRASHQVPSTTSSSQHSSSRTPAYPDVYSLPAAVAYAAAHPRRQIPKFGPYLLLQTLGEGEFGKVKLGLHMEYGEEVAVKLIRRGSVDNTVRFSKIEREIEVLRHLRHPNIVRLYDVIETDKYIGIIIEYASGGELFDHILAHRYLREKDAAKLFAQLISGVSYLHAKKIVHRDLKLENLLLDRNRNVIITDFGFANKFEHKADDLMQTSCGSPCYAAPELVISEGLYVGSAVDIWSCGVILYAMLAGYLPFDDDPANPDGDNINLLYKYIINTQLTFPDYVSVEARDLLGKMLVPDPSKRSHLDEIKRHPWLKQYSSLFEKSVEELEQQAMEIQNAKRLQYQKMMRKREMEAAGPPAKMNRTQSARLDTGSGMPLNPPIPSSASTRAGRTQHPEFLYETGGADLVPPTTGRRAVASAILPTSHASAYDDDPFGVSKPTEPVPPPPASRQNSNDYPYDDSSRTRKASTRSKQSNRGPPPVASPVAQSPQSQKKKAGGYRHTIQLEYDNGEQQAPPVASPPLNGISPPPSNGDVFVASPIPATPVFLQNEHRTETNGTSITASTTNGVVDVPPFGYVPAPEVLPPVVDTLYSNGPPEVVEPAAQPEPEPEPYQEDVHAEINGAGEKTPKKPSRDSAATPKGKKASSTILASDVSPTPVVPTSPTTPKGSIKSNGLPPSPTLRRNAVTEPIVPTQAMLVEDASDALPTPLAIAAPVAQSPSPTAASPTAEEKSQDPTTATPSTSSVSVTHSASTASNKSTRHRKGLSLDKFNFNKLLGSSATSAESVEKYGPGSKPPLSGSKKPIEAPPSAFDPKSFPVSVSNGGLASETASTKSKTSRRKTLTLMMGESFGSAKAAVKDRSRSHRSITESFNSTASTPAPSTAPVSKRASSVTPKAPQTADVNGTFPEKVPPTPIKATLLPSTLNVEGGNEMGPGASTGKAKKVMDWFRKRSLANKDSVFTPTMPPTDPHPVAFNGAPVEAEPVTPTVDTYRAKQDGDSSTSVNAPQVVVTAVEGTQPANWSQTPRSTSGQSQNSTDTSASAPSTHKTSPAAATTTTSQSTPHIPPVAKRAAEVLANVAFRNPPAAAATKAFNKTMLRVHHGAVDQATITTGSPPEVFEHVTKVLLSMGIECQKESEFKYRCIRHKKRKNTGPATKESGTQSSLSAFAVSGAAASNGVDRRGLPVPPPSSFGTTGGKLRGLLMRRGSHSPAPQFNSPPLDDDDRGASPVDSEGLAPAKEPIYGDRTVDLHDEVRFSVELTRIDRLEDTFSLDIRRLKGNLRSYKFLYDTLRERATPTQ